MEKDENATLDIGAAPHELLRATPAGRRLGAVVAILLVLALGGVAILILPWLQATMNPVPAAPSIERLRAGFTLLALIVTALAAALAVTGWRIVRSQQAPPPGTLPWRDTRIVRGALARRTGLAYCMTGLVCGALGIGLGITIWIMLGRVADPMSIPLPPGVTILKQTATDAR